MRFNVKSKNVGQVLNYEGGLSFELTAKMKLYNFAACSLLNPRFYVANVEDQIEEITQLVRDVCTDDPAFIAKLAVYSRNKMNMRTIPLVLIVELAKLHNKSALVSWAVKNCVNRPDEIAELLSYYTIANSRNILPDKKKLFKLSNQIVKGLKFAFNKFDEYQFAKWNRKRQIKLADALKLVRPKPKNDAQSAVFKKILTNTLDTPYTWEVEISRAAQEASNTIFNSIKHEMPELENTSLIELRRELYRYKKERVNEFQINWHKNILDRVQEYVNQAKKDKWVELINSKRIGYQAILMNLNNFLKLELPEETINQVAAYISKKENVLNSKMFPFRFLSAYLTIDKTQQHVNKLISALNTAIKHSVANIPALDGNVLIAADVSSSMYVTISAKSMIKNFDIGVLLSLLVKNANPDATIGIFGDRWKVKNYDTENIFSAIQHVYANEGEVGYSTNGHKVLQWALDNKHAFDKVFFFTDAQMYDTRRSTSMKHVWAQYKKFHPAAKAYIFNLDTYGTSPLKIADDDVHLISGWNNEIFNVLDALDNGKGTLQRIESIVL
jgi:hypothetical protein